MLPYFLNLNKRIISDESSSELLQLAADRIESFIDYRSLLTNNLDGNTYLPVHYSDMPWDLKKLKWTCNIEFNSIILMHRPNVSIRKHTDIDDNRKCVIITPLSPRTGYSVTNFYKSYIDTTELPVATCDFKDFNSVLFNTQQIHGLENANVHRYNLQLCFHESFDVVNEMIESNTLFRI